mmetsp:Transcript_7007/g.15296  ORF Transcript_7007/g.15296 Transcript_7007/m.15296 type:complete len:94 (+) Transcript_7007:96-377(+)
MWIIAAAAAHLSRQQHPLRSYIVTSNKDFSYLLGQLTGGYFSTSHLSARAQPEPTHHGSGNRGVGSNPSSESILHCPLCRGVHLSDYCRPNAS